MKEAKGKIVLLLISLSASLLLGEVVIRSLRIAPALMALNIDHIKSSYKISSNPILGYEIKANYRNPSPCLHYGDFPVTNSHGQRDVERTHQKPKGTKRIILLGDSVVAGHGVWNLNNTISRELEKLLQKDFAVEVLNFGVGGYQTLAEVELLKYKGLRYAPDLVVLVFDDSDFEPENRDMWCSMKAPAIVQSIIQRSELIRLIAVRTNLFNLGNYQALMQKHRELLRSSVEKGIKELKDLSLKHGFDLLVVVWPRFSNTNRHVKDLGEFYPFRYQLSHLAAVEDICKRYRIDQYELAHYFIEDYNNKLSALNQAWLPSSLNVTYTIGDTCHPNEYGSGVAARALETILLERKGSFYLERKSRDMSESGHLNM